MNTFYRTSRNSLKKTGEELGMSKYQVALLINKCDALKIPGSQIASLMKMGVRAQSLTGQFSRQTVDALIDSDYAGETTEVRGPGQRAVDANTEQYERGNVSLRLALGA